MKKLFFISLAVIMILSIALSGCGGGGELNKPGGGKEGGRLQLYASANVANLGDPEQTAGPSDAAFSFPVVEPLLIVGADGTLKGWLAESYVIADDGSSITLNLRHDVSFTDGTPFNAEAAKYNLDNGINSTMWPNMKSVEECVIVDEFTVRLDFVDGKFDWGAAKSLASFWSVMMFSPTVLKTQAPEYKMTHVVGTGPYMLTSYERDQKLSYDANPNYWRGKPYLDGIDYNIIPDPTVALLAYKGGDIDVLGVQAKDAQGLIDEGFQIVTSTDMVFNMCIIPSSKNPDSPLADIRVRQAVEYAIDKQALVEGLTYGYGVATNQEFCLAPFMDETCVGYPYDLQASATLLDEAGYPNGITIDCYQVDVMPDDLGLAMQDQLKKANITFNIKKVSIIQFTKMIGGGGDGWEGYVFSYGFPGSTVDPASTILNGPLNFNTTWISCAQPDELLTLSTQAAQELDQTQRTAIYKEISRLMTDKYCMWTFMYYTPSLTSLSSHLKGVSIGEYTEFFVYTYAYKE
ncbi:MAG: ABC transporter substrate-binding protein [Dehalococcoidales bacterium]|nr:ABC transporter substrate-binding protein [Dehalococcoidales bacterium]